MENKTQYREIKGFRQILFALGHIGPGMLNQFITIWLLIFSGPHRRFCCLKKFSCRPGNTVRPDNRCGC